MICFIIIIFFVEFSFSQGRVDGVDAVVGSNMILHSDVLQQTQIVANSRHIDPIKNPYAFQKIYDASLNDMINQYVVLDIAVSDTNIVITDEEVAGRIDEFITQNKGNEAKIKAYYKQENLISSEELVHYHM